MHAMTPPKQILIMPLKKFLVSIYSFLEESFNAIQLIRYKSERKPCLVGVNL